MTKQKLRKQKGDSLTITGNQIECPYPNNIRRQIKISDVVVHENFTDSFYDIALLKLGKIKHSGGLVIFLQLCDANFQ